MKWRDERKEITAERERERNDGSSFREGTHSLRAPVSGSPVLRGSRRARGPVPTASPADEGPFGRRRLRRGILPWRLPPDRPSPPLNLLVPGTLREKRRGGRAKLG